MKRSNRSLNSVTFDNVELPDSHSSISYFVLENLKGHLTEIPEHITKEEVKRVCKGLRIRDWTKLKRTKISPKEAKVILARVNTEKMKIDLEEFLKGMEVELEHGSI